MKVIKDFLPKDLIDFLHTHYLRIPHSYGHTSERLAKGDPYLLERPEICFYKHNLDIKDPMTNYLCRKVHDAFFPELTSEELGFLRIYINVYHPGMDGVFHDDDGEITVMLMVSETLPDSGSFEYKEDGEVKEIPFVKNTLIAFDAKMPHRGRAPKRGARVTLAFKTEKKDPR